MTKVVRGIQKLQWLSDIKSYWWSYKIVLNTCLDVHNEPGSLRIPFSFLKLLFLYFVLIDNSCETEKRFASRWRKYFDWPLIDFRACFLFGGLLLTEGIFDIFKQFSPKCTPHILRFHFSFWDLARASIPPFAYQKFRRFPWIPFLQRRRSRPQFRQLLQNWDYITLTIKQVCT